MLIAILCILVVARRRTISNTIFPLLIFSISISLACQAILTSRYLIGWDVNLEYYVYSLTLQNGHWGLIDSTFNSFTALNYNAMFSITLLPTVYSVLMNVQGELVFKMLYPFILSIFPLILYSIYEKQFGKLAGFLSVLFFVFTATSFYHLAAEPVGLNRQIIGGFFLALSILLLLKKNIDINLRRVLLVTLGIALALSHYSLAYLYFGMLVVIFLFSKVRPRFNDVIDSITLLSLFVTTSAWYTLGRQLFIVSIGHHNQRSLGSINNGQKRNPNFGGNFYPLCHQLRSYNCHLV